MVADPSALTALTGTTDPAAAHALATGGAVVFDRWAVDHGAASIDITTFPDNGSSKTRTATVPAVAVTDGYVPAEIILSPALAHRIGTESAPADVLADDRITPDADQTQALRAALARVAVENGPSAGVPGGIYFRIERGFHDRHHLQMLLLVLIASIVAIAAAGTATGLANSERADDIATLEAVGASPAMRRVLSLSRAATIALLGALLGTLAGFVPVAAWLVSTNRGISADQAAAGSSDVVTSATASPLLHLSVPWSLLAGVVLGVPLVAAVLAGSLSRSRLPR